MARHASAIFMHPKLSRCSDEDEELSCPHKHGRGEETTFDRNKTFPSPVFKRSKKRGGEGRGRGRGVTGLQAARRTGARIVCSPEIGSAMVMKFRLPIGRPHGHVQTILLGKHLLKIAGDGPAFAALPHSYLLYCQQTSS